MELEGILPATKTVTIVEVNPALSEVISTDNTVTENSGVYTKQTTRVVGASDQSYIFLLPEGGVVSITVTVDGIDTEYTIDCTELSY